jgi:AraC family transcriptional regulator
MAIDGTLRIAAADGVWRATRGGIVRPDAVHSFDGGGFSGAMLFVDPESAEGVWLRASVASDVTIIPDSRLEPCLDALRTFVERPLEAMAVDELIRFCVRGLCAGTPPTRRLDPRVAEVLAAVGAADDLKISLNDAAAIVFLSPSRFAHLFTEHVGLPFRRYVLWRKVTRAMLNVGRRPSLGAAAHAAGFADAAHMTRTFNQMFGIPPSAMLQGEFYEVPVPFEASQPQDR